MPKLALSYASGLGLVEADTKLTRNKDEADRKQG
jgi:hypothetical protein